MVSIDTRACEDRKWQKLMFFPFEQAIHVWKTFINPSNNQFNSSIYRFERGKKEEENVHIAFTQSLPIIRVWAGWKCAEQQH